MENYFNYFTEIEEHFQKCRGTRILLSPLDWALIESWKEAGLPLAAVLLGVERAFEKYRRRPRPGRAVNSLAYCTQEVFRAAEEAKTNELEGGPPTTSQAVQLAPPFSREEIAAFLERNAAAVQKAAERANVEGQHVLADDLHCMAAALRGLATVESAKPVSDFEGLETRLTALEEKLTAAMMRAASAELLAQFHQEVQRGLVPYRRKMSAAQIESLERQFLKKRLLEYHQIPRLSLFYL